MASSKPLGDRSAPAGRHGALLAAPGPVLGRSGRFLGPSWAVQEVPGRLPWRLREAILPRYFGGHIGEVRKLIDFVVSDSFGGFVLTLFFASCSFLAKALGGQDHVEEI